MTASWKLRVTLGLLIGLHLSALFADLLAPYPYAEQHREYPFAAPMRVHFAGFRAFVSDRKDPARSWPVRLFIQGRLFGVEPPGVMFLLGTDAYGRDVLSRLLYGARVSLFTGLFAAVLALALGLAIGTTAGYFGGWADQILMRAGEVVMALPWIYLLLACRAFLPLHISTGQTFLLLIVVIGGVGWVRPARLVRATVLTGKERDFVLAARGFGASNLYLVRRHVIPQTWSILLTQATVLVPQFVLAEVSLSFLGLGVGEPAPSWGNMLADGMQYHAMVSHPWLLIPGFAVVPVLVCSLALTDVVMGRK